MNDCPDTLGDFISPRMHGLKIFVYLTGEEPEALRAELNALGTIDLPTLERYHHRMYALASQKYEELLHTKVDTSGSDLSPRILCLTRSGGFPFSRTTGECKAADRTSDVADRRRM